MGENLPGRVKYWLTEAKHDCFFVVGPENGPMEKIGAIKTLLMGDSEPFRAMLQDSDLAENGDISVTDVEPETFRTFLKCVYSGSGKVMPKLTFEECAKLLYVTEKYLVHDVKAELCERMKNVLSFENIFIALSHPIVYQERSLKMEILKILKFDFNKIIMDGRFLELNGSAIAWILQQKSFTVKEVEIWNAILRWAKHKTGSNEGKVLRPCIFDFFKYLRFLTMDYNEFWENVVPSEILYKEEVYEICKSFGTGQPCIIEHLCNNKQNRYNIGIVCEKFTSSFMTTPKYANIRCLVSSISDLQCLKTPFKNRQYSKTYRWAEHLWNLQINKEMEGKMEMLCVYVGCRGKTPTWECTAEVEISLINQSRKSDKSYNDTMMYSNSSLNWGFSLHDWIELLDPNNGFVKDNNIILMAKIQIKNT